MAPTAWFLAGCAAGPALMSSVALPSQQSSSVTGDVGLGDSPEAAMKPGPLVITPDQRGYLDGLLAVGIHPASELRALSIGSYICQARAAGQNEQAVWDYVAPMVRSDVADSRASAPQAAGSAAGTAANAAVTAANAAIGDYIRVATQRLC